MLQFILSIIAFLCVLATVSTQIAIGAISSPLGYAVSAVFILGAYGFIHISHKEIKED